VGIDPIDLAGSKIIWMTGKNIIWLEINIQDDIYFL
jgi:hypothetical protein